MAAVCAEWQQALSDDERAAFAWRVQAGGAGVVVASIAGAALAVFPTATSAARVGLSLADGAIGPVPRLGLAAGEVDISPAGVTGTPVDDAARLCASARPGRLLA